MQTWLARRLHSIPLPGVVTAAKPAAAETAGVAVCRAQATPSDTVRHRGAQRGVIGLLVLWRAMRTVAHRSAADADAPAARAGRPRLLALVAIVFEREDACVAADTDPVAREGASCHHHGRRHLGKLSLALLPALVFIVPGLLEAAEMSSGNLANRGKFLPARPCWPKDGV